jgi:hypothetical protein
MSGNFTVVDIYLEGLKPRVEKQWQTLGKTPKKKELDLIAETDIAASLAAAQKDRDKWNALQEKAAPQAEVKKEDIRKKLLRPLTLDNGMMMSSFQEMLDSLPSLAPDIFAIHVNAKKGRNDFADWITKEFDPALGAQVKKASTKDEIIQILKNYKPSEPQPDNGPKPDSAHSEIKKEPLPDPSKPENVQEEQPQINQESKGQAPKIEKSVPKEIKSLKKIQIVAKSKPKKSK